MASVWALVSDLGVEIGLFESREHAEAAVDPRFRGTDCYRIREEPLGSGMGDWTYGAVYEARINLETGECPEGYPCTAYRFRDPNAADYAFVKLGRERSWVMATSPTSPESALTSSRRIRAAFLASGKPTREQVEQVLLDPLGNAPIGYIAAPKGLFDVKPGVGSVGFPLAAPDGSLAQLTYRRTDRRTPDGAAIFELAKEPVPTTE